MKHIKYFPTEAEYNAFVESADFVLPNVSYALNVDTVYFHPEQLVDSTPSLIDLGLPSGLLWADRNIGAASPEDAGLYFQWGDTVGYTADETKDTKFDSWDSYFDTTDGGQTFNKYATGKLTTLEATDDAATVHMGSEYRMPTIADYEELIWNTTFSAIDINGNEFDYDYFASGAIGANNLKGIKLTGPNGNSIIFPAAGARSANWWTDPSQGSLTFGFYWTSALGADYFGSDAWALHFSFGAYGTMATDGQERLVLVPIRGVKSMQ